MQSLCVNTGLLPCAEKGATGHDWGKNKDKVAYADIEETIISIVARLTGKTLKRL